MVNQTDRLAEREVECSGTAWDEAQLAWQLGVAEQMEQGARLGADEAQGAGGTELGIGH